MNNKIRVFLADDHTLVREGIAVLISAEEDMEVVGHWCRGPSLTCLSWT